MTIIQALFLLICYTTFSLQQNCINKFVSRTVNSKLRRTTLMPGNFTIQALLQFSERNSGCKKISRTGVIQMYAIKYATDMFNGNITDFPYAIGLQLDDNCGELPNTMSRGIEIVSFHRNESVCRADFLKCGTQNKDLSPYIKQASAVIGTSFSYTSIPLSSLMSLYDIPQISPSASSRLLSNKDLYKSFFRTIPSDINQISVMMHIFKTFGWNYIFAVGSDDDYGKLGVAELKKQIVNTEGICLYKDEYIPYKSSKTKNKVEEVVRSIKDGDKAVVVVLFLYVDGIGDLILQEAEKQGVRRIWLTSEAWNPGAAETFSKDHFESILNQTHGILSVSLRHYPLKNFVNYMKKEIINDYKCNEWLRNYFSNSFNCDVDNFDNITEVFNCSNNNTKTLKLKDIMDKMKDLSGTTNNLIDATTSLCHAIGNVVQNKCSALKGNSDMCILTSIKTGEITEAMKKVNFVNEQNQRISFINGDPEIASYTIDNLVFDQDTGKLVYRNIGHWDGKSKNISKSEIQWPNWFNATEKESLYPTSVCFRKCKKGEKVVAPTKCCWNCQKCTHNTYSNKEMSKECKPCGRYRYTIDNIECKDVHIQHLTFTDSTGMVIVICSMVGLVAVLCSTVFIFKYRALVIQHDKSPHMLTFVCVLLILTFLNGPLHILQPVNLLCQIRNSYFYILLMMYCAFVLVKTQAMTSYLRGHAERSLRGNLLAAQLLVLFLFFLLEVVSVVAWLSVDGRQVREFPLDNKHVIQQECKVDFTAARLVSTFIPCIILIIATFCAFRERNADHSFYEPKFLSFSCIALCIIIVAFLPAFKYILGIYQAIVLAFTMNVFGYTFMACLVLPRVYVGVMRKRKGVNEYPMKSGANKKKSKKSKKKKTEDTGDTSIKTQTNLNEPVEILGDNINLKTLSGNGTVNGNDHNKTEEGGKRYENNYYFNAHGNGVSSN